ncbi:MAG: ABC transporter ATP-binding protein [SAR324 cluster bacterium]|nr:ABC transporter ATP-binding protein [SAR324 cluster bacterium]
MEFSQSIIQLQNIQFYWKDPEQPTLDIPQFDIEREERIFIKGPSGSGKTTLLGLIGGVLQPQSGEITVLGQKLNELRGSRRDTFRAAHIGFIFQMFNLLPYLSVVENVLLSSRFSQNRKTRAITRSGNLVGEAERLLADLGLTGDKLLATPVTELSVGQQQRVAVARALLGSPEILIADEPTSALDADTRLAFLKLLFEECQQSKTTLIFVSHDSSLASQFDRTVILADLNRAARH